jgi:hypothetical protein
VLQEDGCRRAPREARTGRGAPQLSLQWRLCRRCT